jgi:hypothetical protein
VFGKYDASTSVGLGWLTDGVFDTGTEVQLTRVWSALAGYQHIWNPKWRTSIYGGYVNVEYNGTATALINSHFNAAGAANCGVGPAAVSPFLATFTYVTPGVGNSCSPNWSFYQIGTRTQFNPVPQLDIGLDLLYTHHNTAYKGAAVVAATGARPPIFAIDDQDVWSAFFRWQRNFYP